MSATIASRMHRILRKLPHFKLCDAFANLDAPAAFWPMLIKGEKLMGVYENNDGQCNSFVLFTDAGIYWRKGHEWEHIKYSSIHSTKWPSESKMDVRELVVQLTTGDERHIPILGGTPETRDVYEVMRFIDRVVADERLKDERHRAS